MNKKMWNMKTKGVLILITLLVIEGCLVQEDPFRQIIIENIEQCVTPIKRISLNVSLGGISTTPDGSLFGVTGDFGVISLFSNEGEVLWTREGIGSRYALLLNSGKALLVSKYNKEESWKSTMIKLDAEGNTLWERQTGLIGLDGLAVVPDGSFIAIGATDEEKKGHLMLFDQDGNKLWDHQIDGRIETVAVSKSGHVVAGPRDRYIYVYNRNGELIFEYFTGSWHNAAIAPDESFFLFVSEHTYLNCYTLHGEPLWQKEIGDLCNLQMSADGEYIAAATFGELFLLDKNGNELWSKVVSSVCIREIVISAHGEYIAVDTEKGFFSLVSSFEIYSKQGELLWRYEEEHPFKALAMSDDGHYVAAGNDFVFLIFDNFQAIEEYRSSECAQSDKFLMFYRI